MTLHAVFFDLDGTLLDTAPDLAKALNKLLQTKNKSPLPEDDIRRVVSDGAYAMLKLGFGVERDHPDTAQLRQELLDFYLSDLSSETEYFPGLKDLLIQLSKHNIRWGIVTNKPEVYAQPLIDSFDFPSAPVCLICPENVTHRKPHPEPLELACKIGECEPSAAIYVGDHIRDIQCGLNAGLHTIAVNYGYINEGDSAHDWQAHHVAEHGNELWPIVRQYLN
ncbi:MAG: HAD-IA family hydrolase [Agarilytica sp.]